MLVGDGRVTDVLVRRTELARGTVQEEAECAVRVLLDELAHRADVVR